MHCETRGRFFLSYRRPSRLARDELNFRGEIFPNLILGTTARGRPCVDIDLPVAQTAAL